MPVSFARDIVPMFRPIDVEHMSKHKILLNDYLYWSAQQLSLHKKWRSDGYQP
jgi:hypothetical protein